MADANRDEVKRVVQETMRKNRNGASGRQLALWLGALVIGAILGWLGIKPLNDFFQMVANFAQGI